MSTSTYRRARRALPAALTFRLADVLFGTPSATAATPPNVVASSATSLPPAPPWGACGRSTAEDKLVRQFSNGITLRCGGPLRSREPGYGYRHIQFRHQQDFERMVAETGKFRNWRDVADFAADIIAADPDVTKPAAADQTCMSRVVFLADERTGQVFRQQVVVMFIRNDNKTINTLTPRERQC